MLAGRFARRLLLAIVGLLLLVVVDPSILSTGPIAVLLSRYSSALPAQGASPFMASDGTRPISWNPCAPIPYVVNFTNAPSFARSDLASAMATIERYTHFKFVYTGTTNQIPQDNWAQSQRLGRSGWAPLVIAFADQSQTNELTNGIDQLGVGGSAWVQGPDGKVDISGAIVIDDKVSFAPGFGAGTHLGNLFLHELGHVVGLDHVRNPSSFMYPFLGVVAQGVTPSDAAHLAQLSAGGCRPAPSPSWN